MAMVVKNNMSAISTLNTLNTNQSRLAKSLAQVSSGMKINSAQDDASGYAISERMRVMTRSLDQANDNTQNGSSLMKVAEGAVGKTVEILRTLKEKAISAATDTKTDEDRATIQKEINQLVDQIDDNALVTFNGKYLIDGSKSGAGEATYSTWTNQALSEDTSALTKLTEMKARDGEALTIEKTDRVTVSYVQNGKTYTTNALVGDKTLGNIFKMAEDIDQTTQTFATSENNAVAQASGLITGATNKDTIDKSIAYLQDVLSFDANTYNSDTYKLGDLKGSLDSGTYFLNTEVADSSTGLNAGLANFAVTSDASTLSDNLLNVNLTSSSTGMGMGTTYNGTLFENAKVALDNYNALVEKMGVAVLDSSTGAVQSSTGMTNLLISQLQSSPLNITWNGQEGTLQNYKTQIYAQGSPQLIDYYEQYMSAASEKNEAETAMKDAVREYNKGLAQLDALMKLQSLEDDKLKYQSAVDSFINSLRTEMKAAQSGTYTLAAGAAGNQKQLSFDAGNGSLSEAERSAAVENIVSALKDKLYDLSEEAMLQIANLATSSETTVSDTGVIDTTNASTFAQNVSKLLYGSDTSAPAAITFTSTEQSKTSAVLGQNYNGVSSGTLVQSATSLTDIFKKIASMEGEEGSAYKVNGAISYVALAQQDVISKFSGPSLLTGATVGLDPAGKKVDTLDGTVGLTFMAATAGTQGQISGFSISISDSEGNVRKSVNTSLNAWKTTIFAKNASTKDNSLVFHVGASANQSITVDMADMRAEALGLKGKDGKVVDVSTKDNANAAISVFDTALQKALDVQTTVGAIESRLTYTSDNLVTASENLTAAESTIRDVDMAKAMTEYTKNNVLLQAAQSMLAQANQNSSAVLSLLQ
jgi:flagellin-like hook-associated protein FlgL